MSCRKKKIKTDWGLRFYLDVLKLNSLHFGLWDEKDAFNLDGMRNAQDRYTEVLLNMIPDDVKTVLDAGCGTGETAKILKEKGYDVVCLNPDPYQGEEFSKNTEGDIPLHRVKYEEYNPENGRKYDLILMSESLQYMDMQKMAEKTAGIIRPGGYLLTADYFRKEKTDFYKNCKVESDFKQMMEKTELNLLDEKDITEKVLPTLKLGKKMYNKYAIPVIKIVAGYFSDNNPGLSKMASVVFSKKLKKARKYLYEKRNKNLDEKMFREKMRYLFLLYQN